MSLANPARDHAFALAKAGRNPEAVLIMNQLAAEGDGVALFALGYWRFAGTVLPQDLAAGRDLLRRAGDAGHAMGGVFYTNLLGSGIAGPRDWAEALRRLRKEAKLEKKRKQALSLVEKMKLDGDGEPARLPPPQRLSESPHVRLVAGLFTRAECDYAVEVAEPWFEPSVVVDERTGANYRDPVRTSDGSTIHWLIEDPVLHSLNRRLAAATGTHVDQGEPLQILRYQPGQQYRKHLDHVAGRDNQRVVTALVYLNDEYAGGETRFITPGLEVRGKKGDCLVFRNTLPDGRADQDAEHAGLPVTAGVKYLASRWICERPFRQPQE